MEITPRGLPCASSHHLCRCKGRVVQRDAFNLLKEALWPPRHTCNNSHELRSPLQGGATIRKTAILTGAAWLGENSGGALSSSLLCRTLRRHIRRQGDPRGGVTPPTLRWSAAENRVGEVANRNSDVSGKALALAVNNRRWIRASCCAEDANTTQHSYGQKTENLSLQEIRHIGDLECRS